jgi:dUTP pyrophosphatase
LTKGAYALTFNEGVKIPATATGFITSRSSIYRGGAKINSPIWDPGFETSEMGTTLFVESDVIYIEENARVCQFYMISNPVPSQLYNGQFQNKTNY